MPYRNKTHGQLKKLRFGRPVQPVDNRPSSCARGYGRKWRRKRKAFLLANPLCVICKPKNRIAAATHVDHIVPHKGDNRLFWDEDNWQGLCGPCHNTKTAREDGGFGNTAKKNKSLATDPHGLKSNNHLKPEAVHG